METNAKNRSDEKNFSEEYKDLMEIQENNSVIVVTEWNKTGDDFRKFSTYDQNYSPVLISSSTCLVNEI